MLFSRIVYTSLLMGLVAAVIMSIAQQVQVAPIIFAAESFEGSVEPAPAINSVSNHASAHGDSHGHDHHAHSHDEPVSAANASTDDGHGHHHDPEAWAPADGIERLFYSLMSNLFAGIGFSMMMLAVMSYAQLKGYIQLTPLKGVAWGVAAFMAIFVAPAIGLPPEIPGIEAAPVEYRQLWWMFAVVATAAGIAVLAFADIKFKALGLVMIALPHLVGAPHPAGPAFAHSDPGVVEALTQLHQQFIIASTVANLLFWVVLGACCAFAVKRWVLTDVPKTA